MENALLIGLSRQMALQRQMNVIANNLANTQTSGYKGESLKFEQYIMPVAEIEGINGPDRRISSVLDASQVRDFSEGSLTQTGNPLDVAINGKGWLVVQTDDGERYTRAGNLKIDTDGRLVTTDGNPVLGTGGEIRLSAEETEVSIESDGTLTAGNTTDRIRMVTFDDERVLRKEGGTLFSSPEGPAPATEARLMQGFVEKSNVQAVTELTRMIETSRAYISTSQMLKNTSDLRQKAIEQLGRLQA